MTSTSTELLGERSFGCYQISLSISSDKLSLLLSLKLVSGNDAPKPSAAVLLSLIRQIAPSIQLTVESRDSLKKVLKAEKEFSEFIIARGVAPTPGSDGRVVLLVKQFKPQKLGESIELVDHRFIKKFDNIQSETVVARRYPPRSGVDGKDIFNGTIPAPTTNPAELKFDSTLELRNAAREQPYEELVAKQSGYLDLEKGALTIRQHLAIDGDLDFRTGDIEFIGSVSITGSIMKDFSVIAQGDIKVGKDVVGGTVVSKQGSVIIGGNVSGSSTDQSATSGASSGALQRRVSKAPQIRSKGTFQAFALDDSHVEAGDSITVTGDIRNSYVRTHEVLHISEGSLLGGKTYAVKGIESPIIGSAHESSTHIFVSTDFQASAKHADIKKQLARNHAAKQMVRLYLGPYYHPDVDLSSLDQHYREKIIELRKKHDLIKESILGLENLYASMLAEQTDTPTFQLNFSKVFYRGSEIVAEGASYTVEKNLIGPKTILFNGSLNTFETLDFRPMELGETKEP